MFWYCNCQYITLHSRNVYLRSSKKGYSVPLCSLFTETLSFHVHTPFTFVLLVFICLNSSKLFPFQCVTWYELNVQQIFFFVDLTFLLSDVFFCHLLYNTIPKSSFNMYNPYVSGNLELYHYSSVVLSSS